MLTHTPRTELSAPLTLVPAVTNLNLDRVYRNLRRDHPWTDAQHEEAVMWYRRFLTLLLIYPDETLVPTEFIDEVWHTHILDTAHYGRDCEVLFGQFIHHDPNLGEQDAVLRVAAWRTNNLFVAHYGATPWKSPHFVSTPQANGCSHDGPSGGSVCSSKCKACSRQGCSRKRAPLTPQHLAVAHLRLPV